MNDEQRARKALALIGESLREIGILITVFAPLDAFFQKEAPGPGPVGAIMALGLLFMGLGIILETEG